MQSTSANTGEKRKGPISPILTLPNELLSQILAYTVASEVPFHLERFVLQGEDVRMNCWRILERPPEEGFLDSLFPWQRKHDWDWIMVNNTCRRFRECGTSKFFSQKTIIVTSETNMSLHHDGRRRVSPSIRAAIASHARHVILVLPMPSCNAKGEWDSELDSLLPFNAFQFLRSLSIQFHSQPYYQLPLSTLETFSFQELPASKRNYDSSTQIMTPLKEHPAPQKLLGLLKGFGLQVENFQINLIYRDTQSPGSGRERAVPLGELSRKLYPKLRAIKKRETEKAAALEATIRDNKRSS